MVYTSNGNSGAMLLVTPTPSGAGYGRDIRDRPKRLGLRGAGRRESERSDA